MNLSYLSKLTIACLSVTALVLLDATLMAIEHGWTGIHLSFAAIFSIQIMILMFGLHAIYKHRLGIKHANSVVRGVAAGDFERRILFIDDNAEMKEFYWSINRLIDNTDVYIRGSSAAMTAVGNNRYYLKVSEVGIDGSYLYGARTINAAMEAMGARVGEFSKVTGKFETNVEAVIMQLNDASEHLGETAKDMQSVADNTMDRATGLSSSADVTSENVQTVSSATEELSSSIREISAQVETSGAKITQAVEEINDTEKNMTELSESGRRIGDVVAMITDIAAQTNLLALNATIEASRAGEAGRGFAVVANEVKSLADQTSKATTEVSDLVASIQTATEKASASFANAGKTVMSVDEIIKSIIEAVEHQNVATGDIAKSINEVSSGSQKMLADVKQVSTGAVSTQKSASGLTSAASGISMQSHTLSDEVDNFLKEIRMVI
ncbi:MAG: methyl-accepting chemotaxis protein [Alphaproteobacteria bacterium]|nr:methyl-accepting chemotaxis protein [Alphaproteobacteria bacterium]